MPHSGSAPSVTLTRRSLLGGTVGVGFLALAAPAPARAARRTDRYTAYRTHAWGGSEPVAERTGWLFDLPATRQPDSSRRSEVWWAKNDRPCAYSAGATATYEAVVLAELGAAASMGQEWHVLWQLHGTTSGQWKGPAMTMNVSGGQIRLAGGNGHPDHHPRAGRDYRWYLPLSSFTNGREYRVRIETFLSPDPAAGWVSAWVDGRRVLDRVRPSTRSGLRPGTIYPGQPIVNSRSGLYRGSNTGRGPTYRQWATLRDLRIT